MKHIVEVMIPEAEVAARIATLGEEITARYQGSEEVVAIGLLRGSASSWRISPSVPVAHHPDFMTASSYGSGMHSTRDVRILRDLDDDIKGKDVIVEDIIDTGYTSTRCARSSPARAEIPGHLHLLDKPSRRGFRCGGLASPSRTSSWWAVALTTPRVRNLLLARWYRKSKPGPK